MTVLSWIGCARPPHFRPGYEIAGMEALNDFTREVRRLADKARQRLGHDVQIAARLPARPEDARLNGFDFLTWTKEKWVNLITVTAYWGSSDFNMPLELWKALLPKDTILAAGLEILARPNSSVSRFYNTAEIVAGYAASYLYRGADQIYLFNHMDGKVGMKDKNACKKVLENIGEKATVEAMPRRHLVTYNDSRAEGLSMDNILPLALSSRQYSSIRINLGGGTKGRSAVVIIGINAKSQLKRDALIVRFNTSLCAIHEPVPTLKTPENNWQFQAFAISPEALHDGNNMIEIIKTIEMEMTIEWCEVFF